MIIFRMSDHEHICSSEITARGLGNNGAQWLRDFTGRLDLTRALRQSSASSAIKVHLSHLRPTLYLRGSKGRCEAGARRFSKLGPPHPGLHLLKHTLQRWMHRPADRLLGSAASCPRPGHRHRALFSKSCVELPHAFSTCPAFLPSTTLGKVHSPTTRDPTWRPDS